MTTGFEFLHPWFLAGLLLLPLLAWLRGRRGGAGAVLFPTVARMRALARPVNRARGAILNSMMLAGMACMVVAIARPQFVLGKTEIKTSGIDIVLVLDVSRSMLAEDFSIGDQRANRLETVKKVTEEFIKARKNDRIGIVAFAGRPYLVSPLTLDHGWLTKNLERLQIGLVEDGTAIGSAIASGTARLKNSNAKSKLLLLLTDGDNNSGKIAPQTAAEAAAALGVKIYAIGAGTRGTAPYPFQDPFGRTVYQRIPVEFDEEALKKIASLSEGQYFRATDTESLERIFAEIDQFEKAELTVSKFRETRELFQWPLGLGLLFVAARFLAAQTLFRRIP